MQLFKDKPTITQLQWLVWVFVFLVVMLSLVPMDGFAQAIVYAILSTSFYAAIIYGNISWLFPRLYQKGKITLYVLAIILFLFAVGLIRTVITLNIYNALFAKNPEPMNWKAVSSFVIGGVMVFLLSFIFRIAIAYFSLKQQAEDMAAQKTQAELNLLKSQVQPHFLFNTLNNIYYEAYVEAPRTAGLIERLADIMRYFVDESPKQKTSLSTEIQFIENYIALEKIRIKYDIEISFTKNCDAALSIPPMLLMTFVENIFKHGIDKTSSTNKVEISLLIKDDRLIFSTTNTLPQKQKDNSFNGFGIENLRRRLELLYQKDFELITESTRSIFSAYLNIPMI
ncbi:sensor histidine kinase [Mucilaginibacter segetis]|uniref:Sensor histidine kinase n=1 Tax=Mucilaginibacter segetis TaxID=2793071 RepID=A0A934PNJ5_9SPHI|nr:sensor histidine kinase [Mucilaginibacter segetis]MBK0377838.1 sensor histidine kinase [Mucilaginibacter segetis]